MSTLEICTAINSDDQKVSDSLLPCLSDIAGAIDALASRVTQGGRVIYVGAGTSGR
jgi:N-acetylmuramic acid 6-phosphate etherase